MKKACIVGHFGFGENMLNGQTIKTQIVAATLEKKFGKSQVAYIDTHGGLKSLPKIVVQLVRSFSKCQNIIILPAQNGIKIFVPMCSFLNVLFHRKLHYVVIGGWLSDLLSKHRIISHILKKYTGIYVETSEMKKSLIDIGFANVCVMPNFKDIRILSENELVYSNSEPFHLCTFSRVMKEKGIEEAVNAVIYVNEKLKRKVFCLDIYGQVDEGQVDWFKDLLQRIPDYVEYKGFVPFDKSVDYLKNYYALLFPTYYSGEGFAGTLLDAMAAGVPTVCTDWKYNSEIIVQGKTGVLIKSKNQDALNTALLNIIDESWNEMKTECIKEAHNYSPEKVISILTDRMDKRV